MFLSLPARSLMARSMVQYVEYVDPSGHKHVTVANSNKDTVMDYNTRKWWISQGQIAMRWSLVAGLLLLLLLAVFISYLHAQKRIRGGKKPLLYHRWLVPQWQLHLFNHYSQQDMHEFYSSSDGAWQPNPPPPYNPDAVMPPSYQPPPRFSKVVPTVVATEIGVQTDREVEVLHDSTLQEAATGVTRPAPAHTSA